MSTVPKSERLENSSDGVTADASQVCPYAVGDAVIFSGSQARVVFVGTTRFSSGTWCGIELSTPSGSHDGEVKGVRYFQTKPLHGLMVRPKLLTPAMTSPKRSALPEPDKPPKPDTSEPGNLINPFSGKPVSAILSRGDDWFQLPSHRKMSAVMLYGNVASLLSPVSPSPAPAAAPPTAPSPNQAQPGPLSPALSTPAPSASIAAMLERLRSSSPKQHANSPSRPSSPSNTSMKQRTNTPAQPSSPSAQRPLPHTQQHQSRSAQLLEQATHSLRTSTERMDATLGTSLTSIAALGAGFVPQNSASHQLTAAILSSFPSSPPAVRDPVNVNVNFREKEQKDIASEGGPRRSPSPPAGSNAGDANSTSGEPPREHQRVPRLSQSARGIPVSRATQLIAEREAQVMAAEELLVTAARSLSAREEDLLSKEHSNAQEKTRLAALSRELSSREFESFAALQAIEDRTLKLDQQMQAARDVERSLLHDREQAALEHEAALTSQREQSEGLILAAQEAQQRLVRAEQIDNHFREVLKLEEEHICRVMDGVLGASDIVLFRVEDAARRLASGVAASAAAVAERRKRVLRREADIAMLEESARASMIAIANQKEAAEEALAAAKREAASIIAAAADEAASIRESALAAKASVMESAERISVEQKEKEKQLEFREQQLRQTASELEATMRAKISTIDAEAARSRQLGEIQAASVAAAARDVHAAKELLEKQKAALDAEAAAAEEARCVAAREVAAEHAAALNNIVRRSELLRQREEAAAVAAVEQKVVHAAALDGWAHRELRALNEAIGCVQESLLSGAVPQAQAATMLSERYTAFMDALDDLRGVHREVSPRSLLQEKLSSSRIPAPFTSAKEAVSKMYPNVGNSTTPRHTRCVANGATGDLGERGRASTQPRPATTSRVHLNTMDLTDRDRSLNSSFCRMNRAATRDPLFDCQGPEIPYDIPPAARPPTTALISLAQRLPQCSVFELKASTWGPIELKHGDIVTVCCPTGLLCSQLLYRAVRTVAKAHDLAIELRPPHGALSGYDPWSAEQTLGLAMSPFDAQLFAHTWNPSEPHSSTGVIDELRGSRSSLAEKRVQRMVDVFAKAFRSAFGEGLVNRLGSDLPESSALRDRNLNVRPKMHEWFCKNLWGTPTTDQSVSSESQRRVFICYRAAVPVALCRLLECVPTDAVVLYAIPDACIVSPDTPQEVSPNAVLSVFCDLVSRLSGPA